MLNYSEEGLRAGSRTRIYLKRRTGVRVAGPRWAAGFQLEQERQHQLAASGGAAPPQRLADATHGGGVRAGECGADACHCRQSAALSQGGAAPLPARPTPAPGEPRQPGPLPRRTETSPTQLASRPARPPTHFASQPATCRLLARRLSKAPTRRVSRPATCPWGVTARPRRPAYRPDRRRSGNAPPW